MLFYFPYIFSCYCLINNIWPNSAPLWDIKALKNNWPWIWLLKVRQGQMLWHYCTTPYMVYYCVILTYGLQGSFLRYDALNHSDLDFDLSRSLKDISNGPMRFPIYDYHWCITVTIFYPSPFSSCKHSKIYFSCLLSLGKHLTPKPTLTWGDFSPSRVTSSLGWGKVSVKSHVECLNTFWDIFNRRIHRQNTQEYRNKPVAGFNNGV